MPLASSRHASLKRTQALEAEKKERKRMRLSLPSTIASTTAVNEEKVQRRLSSRRQSLMKASKSNDENEAPNQPQGPTPYWKVRREKPPQCHAVQYSAESNWQAPLFPLYRL